MEGTTKINEDLMSNQFNQFYQEHLNHSPGIDSNDMPHPI